MGLAGYSLLAIAFAIFHYLTLKMEFHKAVYNHRPGHCHIVDGPVHGAEDIEIIRPEGIAFISSGISYLQHVGGDHIKGQIFLLDLNVEKTPTAVPIVINEGNGFDKKNFHPHGISSYKVNGNIRLFVVSHSTSFEHTIYLFDYDKKTRTLSTYKTIQDKELLRPNDLVAVGPESFIFTNDGVAQSQLTSLLEKLIAYHGGTVTYYDGNDFHSLLTGLPGPNGITWDAKKNILFVAFLEGRSVSAYQLSKDKTSLTELSTIDVQSAIDNLNINEDGSILLGCHPVLHKAFRAYSHCEDHLIYAPSQILRVRYDSSYKEGFLSEVYLDDGRQLSMSTVAALFGDHLLIGSLCRQLVHCYVRDHYTLS